MSVLTEWVRARKTTASAVVIAIVAGIPLTVAALHPGFPVSAVDLTARDVWVTNGPDLLGGRLNRQIEELNASVSAPGPRFDIRQDGDTLFLVDPDSSRVESVDPATTKVTSAIDIPEGADVAYGGNVLAIVSPTGEIWAIPAVGDLQFNYISTPPLATLGAGTRAVVTAEGAVIAVSAEERVIARLATLASPLEQRPFAAVGEFQLAAAGEQAIVLDQSTNELITEGGKTIALGEVPALQLQHSSREAGTAVLATATGLLYVHLDTGEVVEMIADTNGGSPDAETVAAPVNADGCVHGAWSSSMRYLLACVGQEPVAQDIPGLSPGNPIVFRVNRTVIALNDLATGNVWLAAENMRLVDNWDDITPPEQEESEEIGEEKSAIKSFEDTLAERTETNRPPTAQDDEFGVRPGRTTVFSVLDNDSDPDGDVLVISQRDAIAESTGRLDPIDGSRALQFTPAEGFVGSILFSYTVDDGRGGTASATVTARVVPEGVNQPPYTVREPGVAVEANQTISYNVLADWRDPDGDDLFLVSAAPQSGDLVRFSPDGFITFTHQTGELGEKVVQYSVGDGGDTVTLGSLNVTVEPAGTLNPIGTPDFVSTFVGESVTVRPLDNDLSPSGAQLFLTGMDEPGEGAVGSFNADRGTVTFSSGSAGIFYMKYSLTAGATTSVGIIRVDVLERPEGAVPPIAVKDTVYLRGEEPSTVSVLSNDVSPAGLVLAVQSIDVPASAIAKGVVVELLASTLIRVTSPAALTEQINFTYTISDGTSSAVAGVSVVPVPALTKHQPPVAQNDKATVREGDIVTVDVLANDNHPDGATMVVDENLITPPADGVAFVSNNAVRYQAPREPGEYRLDYRITDAFGESAEAGVTFTVTAKDADSNQDPQPDLLIGRVLAGGSIRVDLPLQGIDPDGDSTWLLDFPTPPALGAVADIGHNYFVYESSAMATGTDVFSYRVSDAFGGVGTAQIKIAVIPQPAQLLPPSAAPDHVMVKPGRRAQVDVTANDSDPQGARISVSDELLDVPPGIEAEVVQGRHVLITAPDEPQTFTLRYELTNDRGGRSVSYVLVEVTPDAPILPPVAEDVPILATAVAESPTVSIDLFDGYAFNPAGRTDDLIVTIEGPNASAAVAAERGGIVEVTATTERQAIAYRVTNTEDELSALAFFLVPPLPEEKKDDDALEVPDPPSIDPALPVQYVAMGETRTWNLADILIVPSGRDVTLLGGSVSALRSDGQSSEAGATALQFTPEPAYRGPASITFTVLDGDQSDPTSTRATLVLPIVVGDPEFRDTPPEFTNPTVRVEVGESTTLDLRLSTAHPNPQILAEVGYSGAESSGAALQAALSGSQLTVSTPRDTPKGSEFTVDVTLRWDKFTVEGQVNVIVVGSTRPPPVAITDVVETKRPVGTFTITPLTNDSNPYAATGEPLRIVDAVITNSENVGSIAFTGTQLRVTPVSSPQYLVIEIVYTIEDATKDPDRRVNGTVRFTVTDVPAAVAKPDREAPIGGDGSATILFGTPGTNGKPILGYEVRTVQTGAVQTNCVAGQACLISGLTNGSVYTFEVRASNENGNGPWSQASDPITPYGTPPQPAPVVSVPNTNKWAPSGQVVASWLAVAATGGTTTYTYTFSDGTTGTTTGLSASTPANLGAGSYTVSVVASNPAKSSTPGASAAAVIQNQTLPGKVGTPSPASGGGWTAGANQWSWPAVSGGADVTDNLVYLVFLNGTHVDTTSGTSYSRSNMPAGSYSITVLAQNNAGQGAMSDASAAVTYEDYYNATVTISHCLVDTGPFHDTTNYPYPTPLPCSGTVLQAGQRIILCTEHVRGGVWWFAVGAVGSGRLFPADHTNVGVNEHPGTC